MGNVSFRRAVSLPSNVFIEGRNPIDIDIFAITLDGHPMTGQNYDAIERYSDSGIFFLEIFADFDEDLPLDNIDVL